MAITERWKGHPPLPEDLERRLLDVVERLRRAGAELIYQFGSSVTPPDADREPADVDLAVWGLEQDRWVVGADVAEILGTDRLDLVLLEEAGPEFRYEIVSAGRLLYAADPDQENRIELRILREYQDLAPFRRTQALPPRSVRRRWFLTGGASSGAWPSSTRCSPSCGPRRTKASIRASWRSSELLEELRRSRPASPRTPPHRRSPARSPI